ncbi:MAG: amidohydrolase family protein, partial [Erysipelotrichaceae bacterium]|nr:amidohydrolase family protein [Erysipelotrichaceae bacterium]
MLLIKNGYIVDPVTNTEGYYDILIDHDEIKQVDQDIKIDHVDVINAKDCIVAPGLVDAHVHFRDPGFTYKEDIITGAAAAKKGGFTTVICMANTNPPVDNIDTLTANIQKGETTKIHVLQCATVTKGMKGQELVDMKALKA